MFIQAGMEKILSSRMDGGIGMARKSRKNRNVESNIQTVVKKKTYWIRLRIFVCLLKTEEMKRMKH